VLEIIFTLDTLVVCLELVVVVERFSRPMYPSLERVGSHNKIVNVFILCKYVMENTILCAIDFSISTFH
jgi:hypothetical protein